MTFKVTLRPSGHVYDTEGDISILSAGLAAGHSLAYSCRAGMCRTCKCKVTAGAVDHGHVSQAYLSDSERREGYALICQARALSDVEIEAQELTGLAGIRSRVTPSRVVKLERRAPDVMELRVRLPMNENLLFAAGQYVDFLLANGERRTYSIANVPLAEGVTELEFHLRHMPGGLFTDHVFSRLKVRDLLTLEGPLGTFFVREEYGQPLIFIAGGTGFAPIKSMLLNLLARRMHEKRPIHFYWGARTREGLYMRDLVDQWVGQYPNFTFTPVVSHPTEMCDWHGRTGNVHEAVLEDHADLAGREVYVCGAPGLVEAARHDFVALRNLSPKDFFADEFLPASERRAETLPPEELQS
ncbi:CDP-6-deoxy-delta-3,4-glucoseen reductase [Paraburkholderia sp. BL10I2N1]|uniref:CDP-6-deoxy-delta-3,4-glucoseen reductase n=1 Tax=Paraburkholderia sp. BL10I2N1 TaxID=1938796 RepID=UPI0010612B9D|nr:CDP-6-deoxy-delta-3,4-glucoseen reductase [Paraburkholderia sp. BL10I2N1]TDN69996.1 CDP-4-dehydro-6-deoxyglucose reductase [Paraburkholderia sp. BL10I2N1]